MELTRRSLLASAAGAAGTPALAGCGGSQAAADGYAVVYALADVADAVAGDELAVVSPVPTGAHGHGWSPEADLQTRVANAELFVYVDSPEWNWAQRFVANFEQEDVAVHVVDALDGADLLGWDGSAAHADDDHEADPDDGGSDHDESDHEENHDDGEGDHDGGDDHGHGDFDPHVWLDPVRAQTIVDTVADAVAAVAPDAEASVRENAAAYREELAALHEEFQAAVETATHDTVVLAGHDSFQYVTDRYGIEFQTPTGVSPDERPSQADLVETIEFVNERGIEYVCYDAFEGDQYASEIVADSDAEATLPLTPLTSRTGDQADADMDFFDVMREENLENLRLALGSDAAEGDTP